MAQSIQQEHTDFRARGKDNTVKNYAPILILWLTIIGLTEKNLSAQVNDKAAGDNVATIEGRVCDSEGTGLPGIRVTFSRLDAKRDDFWWEEGRVSTDRNGGYVFNNVFPGLTYRIHAGGIASTWATSEEFPIEANEISQVKDLVVRPATGRIEGRLLLPDGTAAGSLAFSYGSAAFAEWRMYPGQYLQTESDGSFVLDHLLPNEPASFWVVPENDVAQVWRGLSPGTSGLQLRLDLDEYIDLPPEWPIMGDLQSIAFWTTSIVNSRIDFSLPDLQGNVVSLKDSRFRNKVVLVNLWGTWCGGCVQEIPVLVSMQEKYRKQGLEIIGIAFEEGDHETQLSSVEKFLEGKSINYTILTGGATGTPSVESAIHGIENFDGFPTTIFVARDGMVDDVQIGFSAETPERLAWLTRRLDRKIQDLLISK